MRSRKLSILSCCLLTVLGVAAAWSQPQVTDFSWITSDSRPNFSGTWTAVEVRIDPDGWEPYDNDWTLVITQDESQLSVTEIIGDRENELIYQLDGSESHNEAVVGGGVIESYVSRAHWVEGALIIETTTTRPAGSFSTMRMYYRDLSGRLNIARLASDIRSNQIMSIWAIAYEQQPERFVE